MSDQLPSRVSVPESVLWQQVGDEVVLLDVAGGEYHGLNDVGSRMWRALDEHADVSSAYAHLRETYDVDPEVLRRDLRVFIEGLVGKGLLDMS